ERVAAIEPKLSRLVINVPDANRLPRLEVWRDDVWVPRTEWGAAIPVDPGIHILSAASPLRVPWKADVHVYDGATQQVTIALPITPPPPPPSTKSYSTGMMAGGIVLISISSLGLTAGGILLILGLVGNAPELGPGIGTLVGSGTLLVTGIALAAVGARQVPV